MLDIRDEMKSYQVIVDAFCVQAFHTSIVQEQGSDLSQIPCSPLSCPDDSITAFEHGFRSFRFVLQGGASVLAGTYCKRH